MRLGRTLSWHDDGHSWHDDGHDDDGEYWEPDGGTTPTPTAIMSEEPADPDTMGATIVAIALGNDDFSTLVAALTAAGLVDAIAGEGPFTVFGTCC